MRNLPRAEEEGELAASLVGISGVDMHDAARVGAAPVGHAAVPDEGGNQLVEQRRLADAHSESHGLNYPRTSAPGSQTTV